MNIPIENATYPLTPPETSLLKYFDRGAEQSKRFIEYEMPGEPASNLKNLRQMIALGVLIETSGGIKVPHGVKLNLQSAKPAIQIDYSRKDSYISGELLRTQLTPEEMALLKFLATPNEDGQPGKDLSQIGQFFEGKRFELNNMSELRSEGIIVSKNNRLLINPDWVVDFEKGEAVHKDRDREMADAKRQGSFQEQ